MRTINNIWLTSAALLLLVQGTVVYGVAPLSELDAFKTITIEGSELSAVLGKPIKNFSLAAIIDNEMEPIPYQIDEYNIEGTVYFDSSDIPIAGTPNVFDSDDRLIFTYKDAGDRKHNRHKYDGSIVQEVELTGSDDGKRYVYLVEKSRLRSEEQYVRYSADDALVETDFYSIAYNKENHINWDDFTIEGYSGNENPIDALKIRLQTGLFNNAIRLDLNNGNLVATPLAVHFGAIRSTTQMDLVLRLIDLPLLHINLQLHHYAKSLVYDVRIFFPKLLRIALVDPVLTMSLEGNKLFGAELYTGGGPKEPGITDGAINDVEQQHINNGISQKNNWLLLSTKRNLDIAAFFDYTSIQKEKISLHYNDDATITDKPERFVGQLPNVGYKIHDLPKSGSIGFVININISKGYKGDAGDVTRELRQIPDITILSAKKTIIPPL